MRNSVYRSIRVCLCFKWLSFRHFALVKISFICSFMHLDFKICTKKCWCCYHLKSFYYYPLLGPCFLSFHSPTLYTSLRFAVKCLLIRSAWAKLSKAGQSKGEPNRAKTYTGKWTKGLCKSRVPDYHNVRVVALVS